MVSMPSSSNFNTQRVFFVTLFLSFVSMIILYMEGKEACVEEKNMWKKGHAWKGMDLCRDQWKDGRKGLDGFIVVLYILLSLRSIS